MLTKSFRRISSGLCPHASKNGFPNTSEITYEAITSVINWKVNTAEAASERTECKNISLSHDKAEVEAMDSPMTTVS